MTSALAHARAVLFDLDGTLLDSFRSHFRVYERVFRELRLAFDEDVYVRYYSPNWYLFYERMGLPKTRWPEADRLWLQYYAQEAPAARDGAGGVLAFVKQSGHALGLVTSGDRSRVIRDLDRMGWGGVFDAVVCGGDTPYLKPHPGPLRHALEQLVVRPDSAVYVGDTIEDVRMGKAAGTATAAVTGGFSSRDVLAAEQPDVLLERLDGLITLL